MKLTFIFFLAVVLFSCATRKPETVSVPLQDSAQFVYDFSEGLRYKYIDQLDKAEEKFLYCLGLFPKSTASAYELAEIYIKKNAPELAKSFSDLCLKYNPGNEWYILQSIQILKMQNNITGCANAYEKLTNLKPSNLSYLYDYSVVLFASKKYDLALLQLQKIEDEVGINENISFLRNNIYFEMKRLDAIQLELLRLKKTFPDSTKYSDMLAELYLNSNQKLKALDIYMSLLNDSVYSQFAYAGIAWIYGTSNECIKGYPYLKKVLADENFDKDKKYKIAENYLNKECALPADSLKSLFENLLLVFPDKIELYNTYLQMLFENKEYDKVEEISKRSMANSIENFTAWDYLFNVYTLKGKYSDLKVVSAKAQEYFPNHATVYFFAGYADFYLKNYDSCIKFLETGLDYIFDNPDLLKQFYLYLAESFHAIKKDKQSDQYFEKFLEIDNSNAYVLNNYAYYLTLRKSDLNKAFSMSKRSIEIEPFNSAFLDTYSLILFYQGDLDKALNGIERAYKYGGNTNPVVVEHYGDILFKKNRMDEALEKWKEAYSLNRNNKLLLEKINKTEIGN